jgi:hypothetical protein
MALRPSPDVIAKRLDQSAVLVDISTNRVFELNETGIRIWELLSQGTTVDAIAHQLIAEFDVEQLQATREVNALISRLESEGLLET